MLSPVIQLICMICYAAYTFLGLILFIVGLYYNFAVEGSNGFVTLTACFGGFFMLLVGALGVFSSLKKKALFMAICLLVDILLFIFLLAACITGMFIAFDIQDPVAEGVQLAYCDNPAATTHIFCNERIAVQTASDSVRGKNVRKLAWPGVVELFDTGAPPSCKAFNDGVLFQMDVQARDADGCAFVPCDDTVGATNTCIDADLNLDATDCACLAAIPQHTYTAAVAEDCTFVVPAGEVAENDETTCTLTPAEPANCAIPAPEYERDADGCDADPPTATNCDTANTPEPSDYWTAQIEHEARAVECTTAGSCSPGCRYTPAADAIAEVFGRPARQQVCPDGCAEVVGELEVTEIVERCDVVHTTTMSQQAYCRNCGINDDDDWCTDADDNLIVSDCSTVGAADACDAETTACADDAECVLVADACTAETTACAEDTDCAAVDRDDTDACAANTLCAAITTCVTEATTACDATTTCPALTTCLAANVPSATNCQNAGACLLAEAFDCKVVFKNGTDDTYITVDNTADGVQIDVTGLTGFPLPVAPSYEDLYCKVLATAEDGTQYLATTAEVATNQFYCAHTAPRPARPAVTPACAATSGCPGGETTLFCGAKTLVVGTENVGCTGADCVALADFMGDCDAVEAAFTTAEGIVSRIASDCNTCWDHWQSYKVASIKGNLWPATIAIFSLFLFIVILVCINLFLLDMEVEDDESWKPAGIFKILALVFNGIVLLFGLLTIISGIYMYSTLSSSEECTGDDCTNWAVVSIIIVGVAVFGTAVVSLVSVAVVGGIVGQNMLRIANGVFLLTALLTMICGVAIAIIAGALDESNKQFEENFDSVRAQYEQKDPNVCKVGGRPLPDAECKNVIRGLVSEANTGVVIVLSLICFSFLFVAFFTLQAYHIFSGGDDDDDGDSDDDDQ